MRISTVTILTLSALTATELGQQAVASPILPEELEDPLAASQLVPPELESTQVIAAIAAPDSIAVQTFSASDASAQTLAIPELATLQPIAAIAPPEVYPPETTSSTPVALGYTEPVVAEIAQEDAIAVSQASPSQPILAEPDLNQISQASSEMEVEGNSPVEGQVSNSPSAQEIEELQRQLRSLEVTPDRFGNEFEGSPAITISNPSGYGADNNTGFVNFSFQSRTRYGDVADGTAGFGIGVGDAERSVGVQLSYTIASFGGSRDFGSGGFNAKLHRQLPGGWSIAAGWEGFVTTGGDNDFEDSIYGSVTHVFATTPSLDQPFSRVAVTAGLGSGRFRTEDAIADDDDTIGVFGSLAIRVARPVSAIVEWTGQDLAIGLSIAPIRNVPWVITPAVRDIAGAGDGARFVVGTGFSFQF